MIANSKKQVAPKVYYIILSIFKKVIINKYKNLKTSYEELARISILIQRKKKKKNNRLKNVNKIIKSNLGSNYRKKKEKNTTKSKLEHHVLNTIDSQITIILEAYENKDDVRPR